MWDCRTQGGHFFLYTPQLRSFTCHRCRTHYPTYSPSQPRSSSPAPSPASHETKKMPWRCLLESCSFVCCATCADYLQTELARINEQRLEAENSHTPFDAKAMALKAEECPVTKEDGGGLMKTVMEAVVRPRDLERDRLPSGKENVNTNLYSGNEGPIEVDSEDDSDDAEDVYLALKRPFTRSAAVAAAAAARARLGSRTKK